MTNTYCIADVTAQEISFSASRRIKVSAASTLPAFAHIPAIHLKGMWLDAAGFTPGCALDVKVMQGCIVLTVKEPEPEASEMLQSLRVAEKLSARKQKQVREFIGVISGKKAVKAAHA